MSDEEFANYLAKMKADHVTKMAALEEEAASLREPVKKLDVEIAKECFFIMNLALQENIDILGDFLAQIIWKNIEKESLIASFSNCAIGKDITKSEELVQKIKMKKN